MDPAFLVWIPPLDHDDNDDDNEISDDIKDDHHYEEIPDRRIEGESRMSFDNEGGTSLTPAEYKKMISTKSNDYNSSMESSIPLRRLDLGESRLHDEIISEYRARLSEGMLPIHRILEESRVRVSEESLSRHTSDDQSTIDIIPNRLSGDNNEKNNLRDKIEVRFTPKSTRDRLVEEYERPKSAGNYRYHSDNDEKRRTPAAVRYCLQENTDSSAKSSYQSLTDTVKIHLSDSPIINSPDLSKIGTKRSKSFKRETSRDSDRDYCDDKDEFILPEPKTPGLQRRCKDMTDFNTVDGEKKIIMTESIPLKELNRSGKYESPVRVHRKKEIVKDVAKEKEIQSPDYGVEADVKGCARESFYDFIGEDEGGIKFADDDDDEYVDNKIIA